VALRGEGVSITRTPRVGDWVYQRLREGILLGDFQPGERMRQSDVAEHFDVSHTPVREALARLASDGLVTLHPHRGAVVNSLSPQEIDEIYELREVLDPYIARKTTEQASDEHLDAIHAAAQACAEPDLSSTELFERNRLFHLALYEGCGNQRMVQLFESLWDSVTAIRMFDVYVSDAEELAKMNREHAEISRAVAARDGKRAAELVRQHIAAARRDLLELLARRSSEEQPQEEA
jgi:DNA-binding GntR family transcriptional regulator